LRKVELFLNGQSLETSRRQKPNSSCASFESHAAGELKAVGYLDEKPADEVVVKTASTPAQVSWRLTDAIKAEAGDFVVMSLCS
jgi:hypothetical protein